jgi:SH3-like domain-containing protein
MPRFLRTTLLLSALLAVPAFGGLAFSAADPAEGEATASAAEPENVRRVPRFVSLRSGEVNVRTGPGTRYPVEWVFTRKDIPVEITAEFDTWRRIRDWEGAEGWVHQSMLSGRRAVVVLGDIRRLRLSPDPGAPAAARLEPGVVGTLARCRDQWCEVEVAGYEGWLARGEFWGVYPGETVE